ncbi:MAG: exodeoxyribonuclease VII small subunit [Elusimicrobia bacterium]|nr:exodeoxyribonuclease VII small subunit [Elusimicrobiota bacterium]
MKPKTAPEQPFEKTLEDLETLVRDLEAGDKSLEDSLALFEKGVALSKDLTRRLEEAKTKVEALSQEGGRLVRKPFEREDNS